MCSCTLSDLSSFHGDLNNGLLSHCENNCKNSSCSYYRDHLVNIAYIVDNTIEVIAVGKETLLDCLQN